MKNKNISVFTIGPMVSDELTLIVGQKPKQNNSVQVGDSIGESVASFYNELFPLELIESIDIDFDDPVGDE